VIDGYCGREIARGVEKTVAGIVGVGWFDGGFAADADERTVGWVNEVGNGQEI
jgi:hypothetical protein